MSKLFYLTIIISCLAYVSAEAQANALIRQGNMLYDEKRYKDAATEYNKVLQKNPANTPALFNLGNSLYQQKQFDATRKVMEATAKVAKDKDSKGEANYTIGNTYMEEKKWEDAISSYKNALRNNPRDADAKYNLSYAEEMLKKNQKGGGGKNKDQKNKDNKQDQKQNKDQQNKDQQNKDKQNKDQQDKDKQDKDKQDKDKQDQQHPQSQPSKLSQQQADQLLNALQQEEKKLQEKNQKEKGIPVKMDKDW